MKQSQHEHWKNMADRVHDLKNGGVYAGLENLPKGQASDHVTEGCLVLEGGAFRGIYTSGVLDALMEADINLRCTVGVSAGALNGVNYVSGQIGRSGRINLQYRHDSRYVGVEALKANRGIIGFNFLMDELNGSFHQERFDRPDRRFVAVAANLRTGKAEYFEKGLCGDIMKAVQASASMPYVSAPVEVDGIPCLDGGCAVKIPIDWALDQGYQKILVVRTRPADYRKEGREEPTALRKGLYAPYPAFIEALSAIGQRYNRTCDRLEQLEAAGRIFVISPSQPVSIHRLEGNMEKLGDLYYLGYHDGQTQLEALRRYLDS